MPKQHETEKKKPGRPPRHSGETLKASLSVRLRDGLYERLRDASAASGRSMSEEIERRVEDHFRLTEQFGTGERLNILRLLASVLQMTEMLTKNDAYNDRAALIEAKAAIIVLLDNLIDRMGIRHPGTLLVEALSNVGAKGHAAATLQIMAANASAADDAGEDEPPVMPMGGQRALGLYARMLMDQGADDPTLRELAEFANLPAPIMGLTVQSAPATPPSKEARNTIIPQARRCT